MTNTTSSVTYVSALSFVLDNCDLPAEISEKLTALRDQTQKRNSAVRKPTAKQRAAADASLAIADEIRGVLAAGKAMTVAEIIEAAGIEASSQKVSGDGRRGRPHGRQAQGLLLTRRVSLASLCRKPV